MDWLGGYYVEISAGDLVRNVRRGMFSMDDGNGNNALIIATSYPRWITVGAVSRVENVLRIHSLDSSTGAVLWTTDLVLNDNNN